MLALRISTIFLVYCFLYWTGIGLLLTSIFQRLINAAILAGVAYLIGNYAYRKYITVNLIGKVKPDLSKVIVITGCDSGFGFRAAVRMSIRGFTVVAGCLSESSDGAVKLKQMPNTHIIALDVTKNEDVKRFREEVDKILDENNNLPNRKHVFALINNAGIAISHMIEWHAPYDVSDFEKVLNVNTLGVIRMTRAFIPLLRSSKGRIINIASAAAREVMLGMSSYAVSKAASSKFSESLELEIGSFGVQVITFEPFFYKTDLVNPAIHQETVKKGYQEADEEVRKFYSPKMLSDAITGAELLNHPLVTNGDPEELVDVIEEAVTSPDPEKLYQPGYQHVSKLPLYSTSNFMPWNFSMPLKRLVLKVLVNLVDRIK